MKLARQLRTLRDDGVAVDSTRPYDLQTLRAAPMRWDRVTRAGHLTSCTFQRSCNFSVFVSDGMVLREEQVGNYPSPNDPAIPDPNPRGCNKGACYAHRIYDPARVRYPLKRRGARGEGRWQRVSWDHALTEIADQLIDILTTDGPDTIIQGAGTHVHASSSESMGTNALFEALDIPLLSCNMEIGDDHQGAAVTLGKVVFGDSPENWFHADIILVWGSNPAYTNIPNYHYLAEARYSGTKVVAVSPDHNASAIHADLWLPVNVGTDAALALGLAQVIVRERLFNAHFVREQTDLPLLVRTDTGKLLREHDLKRGGRDDVFYWYDEVTRQIVEAPRKSLTLGDVVPALEGEYEVRALGGRSLVRPGFAVLRDRLDAAFTPEQVARITGTPASLIVQLAREIAGARGVVNMSSSVWGKFYHGDIIERAMILVFALAGHLGRKGATFSSFSSLTLDTGVGMLERQGRQMLQTVAGADPRYAGWKEAGYTPEMILNEYAKDAVANGGIGSSALVQYVHGGLLDLSEQYQSWDPHLKRPLREYVGEAFAKGWQVVVPAPQKEPRAMLQWGGNLFRRSKATNQLIAALLQKLRLVVTVDSRMSATALYSDYVLPACGWYERVSTNLLTSTQSPFIQINDRAISPLYESLSDWAIARRLAQKLDERARARGILNFRDRNGEERRLDRIEEAVTAGGLYPDDDEEGVARDAFVNASNREQLDWDEFKARGIAAYTGLGTGVRGLGHACDMAVGEPFVALTWHTERKQPYPTLTRRIQFYIDHDWYLELDEQLPIHQENPRAGGNYPLQLTAGHARWSIHSNWIDDAVTLSLQRGEPAAFLSVDDAGARGVRDGDSIEVYNDIGSFRIQATVSPAVRPGQIIVYHGWENYQFPGWQHFKSVMPAPLNPIELAGGYGHLRADAVALSPGLADRGTRVEVRRNSHVG